MLAVEEEVRTCSKCGDERPVREFRLRVAGGTLRHSECAACHRLQMNRRNARLRSQDLKRFCSRLAAETEWERANAILNSACRRFGGAGKLAAAFAEEIKLAQQYPESPTRARLLLAYFNLLPIVEQNKPPAPSLNHLSDEELACEMMLTMMKDRPDVVVMMGEALGWTLSPPTRAPESAVC